MLRWVQMLGKFQYEARLHRDGRVEVNLQEASAHVWPAAIVPPDELKTNLERYIRRKWAYYITGDR